MNIRLLSDLSILYKILVFTTSIGYMFNYFLICECNYDLCFEFPRNKVCVTIEVKKIFNSCM